MKLRSLVERLVSFGIGLAGLIGSAYTFSIHGSEMSWLSQGTIALWTSCVILTLLGFLGIDLAMDSDQEPLDALWLAIKSQTGRWSTIVLCFIVLGQLTWYCYGLIYVQNTYFGIWILIFGTAVFGIASAILAFLIGLGIWVSPIIRSFGGK